MPAKETENTRIGDQEASIYARALRSAKTDEGEKSKKKRNKSIDVLFSLSSLFFYSLALSSFPLFPFSSLFLCSFSLLLLLSPLFLLSNYVVRARGLAQAMHDTAGGHGAELGSLRSSLRSLPALQGHLHRNQHLHATPRTLQPLPPTPVNTVLFYSFCCSSSFISFLCRARRLNGNCATRWQRYQTAYEVKKHQKPCLFFPAFEPTCYFFSLSNSCL